MAYSQIDPARLEGDALTNWYRRSPADIEQERNAAASRRYADFFGDQVGSLVGQDGTALDQLQPDRGDGQFGQDPTAQPVSAPFGDSGLTPAGDSTSIGQKWGPDEIDPTTSAPALFGVSQHNGNVQLAGDSTKDQCIKQCSPLLERYQPPGSDRNRWDFHKCVNACMDSKRPSSQKSAPSGHAPPLPTPAPSPWWMWIPRLVPEIAPVLV